MEDSEEEDDFSLDVDSPSPKRPRKRAKHSQDADGTKNDIPADYAKSNISRKTPNPADLPEEDEPWLQPQVQVARTYGRNSRPTARTPSKVTVPSDISRRLSDNSSQQNSSPRPSESTLKFWHHGPTPTDSDTADAGEPRMSQKADSRSRSKSPGNNSEALPSVFSPMVLASRGSAQAASLSSSPLSSPLSAISPSPSRVVPNLLSGSELPSDLQLGATVDADAEAAATRAPTSAAQVRRNLRSRKPEQLAPYQLERARYLQQCRSRGVKPIRLIEQAQMNSESQSASQISNGERQEFLHSSSPIPEERFHQRRTKQGLSFDEFDVPNSPHHRLPKRRRTASAFQHRADGWRHVAANSTIVETEDANMPISPASTASEGPGSGDASPSPPRFKFPDGFTPAHLPTPQISSDAKRIGSDGGSSTDSPPRRSRHPARSRDKRQTSIVSLSSGSEQLSEEVDEDHDEGLRRQQKRIRGVLPASWLNIDFKAQNTRREQATARTRPGDSPSLRNSQPQKGLARRVTTIERHNGDDESALSALPNNGDDSDDLTQPHGPSWKQRRLDLSASDGLALGQTSNLDDDLMENDFIDPMLAGKPTSHHAKVPKRRFAQPRITESFRNTLSSSRQQFSEERTDIRRKRASRQLAQPTRKRTQNGRSGQLAARLSVADAPSLSSPTESDRELPQFVRLALRRTRHDVDRGRHSPTNKSIRLATAQDTEEASSVLRAWREGKIKARGPPDCSLNRRAGKPPTRGTSADRTERSPLQEVSRNERQTAFPNPHSRPKTKFGISAKPQPRPRVRQTHLQPVVLDLPRASSQSDAQHSESRSRKRKALGQPRRGRRLRDAQVETLQSTFEDSHRAAAFESRMQCLTENLARRAHQTRPIGFQLQRYLGADDPAGHLSTPTGNDNYPIPQASISDKQPPGTLPYRARKQRPRRIDVEVAQYAQPVQEPENSAPGGAQDQAVEEVTGPVLQGLGAYGNAYTTDFNIRRLGDCTRFHEDGFIGSGELEDALALLKRDLDHEAGRVQLCLNGSFLEWSAWNEAVASQVDRLPSAISEALHALEEDWAGVEIQEKQSNVERNIDYLLRSLVRYISKCLHFMDPVDRRSCIETFERLVQRLVDIIADFTPDSEFARQLDIRMLQYVLVVTKQAALIGDHPLIGPEARARIESHLASVASSLSKYAVIGKSQELRTYCEESQRSPVREAGISDQAWALSSVVILNHVLGSSLNASGSFWKVVGLADSRGIRDLTVVQDFERLWHEMFSILPALMIGSNGRVCRDMQPMPMPDNWGLVDTLLKRLFELYNDSSKIRGHTVNSYIRATLARCHCLVTSWGWWKCEPILKSTFDFFAHRGLALLRNEESHGSPKFLEDAWQMSSLEVLPDDCSFHIFLKLLATALRGMREHRVYDDKKIRNIGYRVVPNHGRSFQKETAAEQRDLEALRNHFDLLCTLYCALPPRHRIALDLVQNLIDHSVSHREACRLSVRAWANITSFQISTSEHAEALSPLTEWYESMLRTTISQFRLARAEGDQALKDAESEGLLVPRDELERIVSSNQQQITKTLLDLIAGLKRALQHAKQLLLAKVLVEGSSFWQVFDLFDASNVRLQSTILEALMVVEVVIGLQARLQSPSPEQQDIHGDSQEYGDFSALQEFAADEQIFETTCSNITEVISAPIAHFLSNVFGADRAAEDTLLQRLVDVWVNLANEAVVRLRKSWSLYVDEYSATSWHQLRDTAQKRKYTTYFIAKVITHASGDEDVKTRALTAWFLSLVEREATLKFQHLLTSALLNACPREPLLQNLPFMKDARTAVYHITWDEVRQRRLSLISSILSNMRETLERLMHEQPSRRHEFKSVYVGMLRQAMQTMKANYQELQSSSGQSVASVNVQGAYVEFVQQVVSFLQQHTFGICRVDPFFTDSSAFPLPAGDPTYVVGRLRSYEPKLHDANTRKQLSAFIQSVSERAATDGEQQYLVGQLSTAMKAARGLSNADAPSLGHILLTAIFPAYVDNALSTACSWILALPILEAAALCLPDLMYNIDIKHEDSVLTAMQCMAAMLSSIEKQRQAIAVNPGILALPHVQKTVAAMFEVARSCLTLSSFIQRSSRHGEDVLEQLRTLIEFVDAVEGHICDDDEVALSIGEFANRQVPCRWPDTLLAADKQVRDSLASWYALDGRYFVRRCNTTKEIAVALDSGEDEQRRLLQALTDFRHDYHAILDHRHNRRCSVSGGNDMMDDIVVV